MTANPTSSTGRLSDTAPKVSREVALIPLAYPSARSGTSVLSPAAIASA